MLTQPWLLGIGTYVYQNSIGYFVKLWFYHALVGDSAMVHAEPQEKMKQSYQSHELPL